MMKSTDELGFCGADCGECNIYRANVLGEELKKETIKRWQADVKQYHGFTIQPEDLNCRGCRNASGQVSSFFTMCPVRKCCTDRGYDTCGMCPELVSCVRIEDEGRRNLENTAKPE